MLKDSLTILVSIIIYLLPTSKTARPSCRVQTYICHLPQRQPDHLAEYSHISVTYLKDSLAISPSKNIYLLPTSKTAWLSCRVKSYICYLPQRQPDHLAEYRCSLCSDRMSQWKTAGKPQLLLYHEHQWSLTTKSKMKYSQKSKQIEKDSWTFVCLVVWCLTLRQHK